MKYQIENTYIETTNDGIILQIKNEKHHWIACTRSQDRVFGFYDIIDQKFNPATKGNKMMTFEEYRQNYIEKNLLFCPLCGSTIDEDNIFLKRA